MGDTKRLGLGCMGMCFENKERSIETVRYALDHGVTLLNTGEFYRAGESEMVLREALQGVPRDKFFISVKFGVLPQMEGGIYGLDVKPFNVKAHLCYSLHRLGLSYVDLYEPARMDESVPVEELMAELMDLVKQGYIKHIGLTQMSNENFKRALKVTPLKMIEMEYSLVNHNIEENGILETAKESKTDVLTFGVLCHGLISEPEDGNYYLPWQESLVRNLKVMAEEKNTTVERLSEAYVFNKHPEMKVLIGTTRKEHLEDAIKALDITLTEEDIKRMESFVPYNELRGHQMRNFLFQDGRIIRR